MDKRIFVVVTLIVIIGISVAAYSLFMPKPKETATITGKITDSETGDPIEGATVTLDGKSVTTASDGTYSFTVDVGSYTLSVSKTGYEKSTQTLEATEAKTYTLNIPLTSSVTPAPPPSSGIVLKIITRHGADIVFKAEQLFLESEYAKKYNIVDIKWLPAGPTLWVDLINRSGDIDVGWGGGPVLFDTVYEAGLLAPLTSDDVKEALKEIPDEIANVPMKRYSEGKIYWVGSAIASFGFTINKNYLAAAGLPEPKRWTDLANETYALTLPSPSVGTADATKSTSNTRMFEIILQRYGWEKGWKILTLMGANARIFDQSGSVRDAVMLGEIGVGTTIDFYGYTAQLENPGICKYVLPEDGTIVNGDPIALLTTSKHPEAAQAFIAWAISAEGQKPWLDPKINRLPINPRVFDTPEGKERTDLESIYNRTLKASVISFSDEIAISYEYSMMWFYHATIVRSQLKLANTWMELAKAKAEGTITQEQFSELVDKLSNPHLLKFIDPETGNETSFTEEYAKSINQLIKDPTFRTEMVSKWIKAAEDRYDAVLQELQDLLK